MIVYTAIYDRTTRVLNTMVIDSLIPLISFMNGTDFMNAKVYYVDRAINK